MNRKPDSSPTVSVVMPVFHTGPFIVDAINSILNQTFSNLELLIICDEPEESLLRTLDGYAAVDSRIKVHVNRTRIGLVAARNQGIRLARGKYIGAMDSDDISHPERIERQVAFFEEHPEIGLLGTGIEYIDTTGHVIRDVDPIRQPKTLRWALFFENPLCQSSVMIRSDVLRTIGGYDETVRLAEDYDLWIKLASITGIQMLPDLLLRYRVHGSNISLHQRAALDRESSAINSALLKSSFQNITDDEIKIFQHLFLRRDLSSKADAPRLHRTIDSMYQEFLHRERPSREERKEIRKHLGLQYLILAYLSRRVSPHRALLCFISGFRHRPSLPLDALRMAVRNIGE